MNKIQGSKPQRTCTKSFKRYQDYKPFIKEDFSSRCGYCDDHDFYMGGSRGYHIDHFKPKKHFPKLEVEYGNLVYSCPFCNTAKSDKWIEEGFLDPCTEEYDDHVYRNQSGEILFTGDRGEYIYTNLKLYLRRHQVIWLIEKLRLQKKVIEQILKSEHSITDEEELKILRQYYNIQSEIDQKMTFFRAE